jgi:hypothetical protein
MGFESLLPDRRACGGRASDGSLWHGSLAQLAEHPVEARSALVRPQRESLGPGPVRPRVLGLQALWRCVSPPSWRAGFDPLVGLVFSRAASSIGRAADS